MFDLCLKDKVQEFQQSRWTGAWVTWNLFRMFAEHKGSWESFACDLGVIEQEKKEYYGKKQRQEDLAKIDALESKFAVHDWSLPEDGE